jgi:hypothetical protein
MRAYRIWQQDAFHPSLHFKKVDRHLVQPRVIPLASAGGVRLTG